MNIGTNTSNISDALKAHHEAGNMSVEDYRNALDMLAAAYMLMQISAPEQIQTIQEGIIHFYSEIARIENGGDE